MKQVKTLTLTGILFFSLLIGCSEQPVDPEGNTNLTLKVLWSSSDSLKPLSDAEVILSSEYGITIRRTDAEGILLVTGLPSGVYNIAVRKPLPEDNSVIISGSLLNLQILSGKDVNETIVAKPISSFGISINEIYSAARDNQYYFDQYIELYNSSDSTKFLDGIMVMSLTYNSYNLQNGIKGSGADQDDDNDIDGVTYVFRFPGTPGGKEHPILPGEFIVLASDAANHTDYGTDYVNLSSANWEFYNQYTLDFDNPSVKNLRNIKTDEDSDFLMRLYNGVIIISTGADSVWSDGIDIATVIDGIQYLEKSTSRKTLDDRIDKGFLIGAPRYSGKSIQRRSPGVDTNNGLLDWEIINPTPGYQ